MPNPEHNPLIIPHADVWALLDVIPDALLVLDNSGRCRYANSAVEKVLGRSSGGVLGRPVCEVLNAPEDADFTSRLQRAMAEQRSDIVEWATPDRGVVSVQIQPRASWVALLLRRNTPARQPTCDLDEPVETRFLHAQKMELLGRLAGGIAHDFNNLLTVIKGYCGFVADELPAGSAAHDDMSEVLKATNSAGDLTRQLLDFSRKSVAEPRALDVKQTVTRIAGMLRRVLGEDINVEIDVAPGEYVVLADAGKLEQALMNLAVNARDAMPGGGTLVLRTAGVAIDAESPHSGVRAPGMYVSIVVEDSGVGIAPEAVERIFEAFYTTKGGGTGLGLAMVRSIVEQLGGDICVESAPGRGSRFTILLPAVDTRDDMASRASTSSATTAPPPCGAESILLVEDEPGVRRGIRRMLERLGYRVREAATGAQALGIAATLTEPPDLVLTDVVMPGQSGPEVARRLLQRWPSLKVLFMSGYTSDEISRRGINDADVRLLEKPIALELVGHAVRRALDGAKAA